MRYLNIKLIFFKFIFLISFLSFGQSNKFSNFVYEDGSVIWQKVYETELHRDDVVKYFEDSGIFISNSLRVKDNTVSGETAIITPNYDGAGVKPGSVPIMFREGYKGFVLIELKDTRYRVTMSRGVFVSNLSISIGNVTAESTDTNFDFVYNMRKEEWKNFFVKNGRIVNYSIEKSFEIIENKSNTQDW